MCIARSKLLFKFGIAKAAISVYGHIFWATYGTKRLIVLGTGHSLYGLSKKEDHSRARSANKVIRSSSSSALVGYHIFVISAATKSAAKE